MSAKFSGGHFSYAKALIFFVALLACSNSSVAAAESSSVIRNAHGLDKSNVDSRSVSSINRHLRSSADTAASDYVISRRLGSSLMQSLSKFVSDLRECWWRLWQKSSHKMYKDLKLYTAKDGPFTSPNILDWVTYVKSLYRKSLDAATKAMFLTLARRYKDAADLAEILVKGKSIEQTESIASKLLGVQVQRWIKKGKSAAQVFQLLKLDQTEGGPFESPVFLQWVDFVHQSVPVHASDTMLLFLAAKYKTDAALARVLMEGKKIESMESIASELLSAQALRWKRDGKSEAHVFKLLELHETGDKLFENSLFMQWVAFVKLMFPNPDNAIGAMYTTLKVHYTNDEELTNVLAAGTKIPATKEIALSLQEILPHKLEDGLKMPDFPTFGFGFVQPEMY